MAIPPEILKHLAHVDQTRAHLREVIKQIPRSDLVEIIRTAASGKLDAFDERTALLVGMLAVIAIHMLFESEG
ncbi:MAG: hypothetical protein R3C45_21030 [Phycisphaerales bacterium]